MSTEQTYCNKAVVTADGEVNVHVNAKQVCVDDDGNAVHVLAIEVTNYERKLVQELIVNADRIVLTVGGE